MKFPEWFDRSEDMSVHVLTWTTYGFNAWTPVVWKLWRWYDVCVSTSRHKNESSVFTATNQRWILCEISNECKWHLCDALRGLWERSYEKVECFWVAWTVQRGSREHGRWLQSSSFPPIIKGIVHFQFISQGQTVNPAYYVEILKRLREAWTLVFGS
jgi:hypothetical protein